jgi:hypothetical protein
MIRASILILALLGTHSIFYAADEPAAPAPSVPPYELKNRSTFSINRETRAPFWPVGWRKELAVRAQTVNVPAAKAFEIQPHHFKVTSVLLGNPPVAIINGRGFGEGELLPVVVGDLPVQVVIRQIRDGGVWLEQGTHRVFVPLKREALPPRPNAGPEESKEQFKIQIQEK